MTGQDQFDLPRQSTSISNGKTANRRKFTLFGRGKGDETPKSDDGLSGTAPLGATVSTPIDPVPIDPAAMIWRSLRRVNVDLKEPVLSSEGLSSGLVRNPLTRSVGLLRTRVITRMRKNGWKRVAIVAPTQGCGATFMATRLAISVSRTPNLRAILLDMNMHRPGVADAIGVRDGCDTRGFLTGEFGIDRYILRTDKTLAVGLSHHASPDTAELLIAPRSSEVLSNLQDSLCPDITLFDLPPLLECDDALAFLPQVDCVLLVADATRTSPDDLRACERLLSGQTGHLGVVLNQGRATDLVQDHG